MKIRFDTQSIRLRVRKSDIAALAAHGEVVESVQFPQGKLTFILTIDAACSEISTRLEASTIFVQVPTDIANTWMNSQAVGIEGLVSAGNGEKMLIILIEKDFPCKHGSAASNADTFDELQ